MLNEAKAPVRAELLDLSCVRYICGDLHTFELPPDEFHLAYSLGVFGNGCSLKPPLVRKILASLRPGGTFFFDVPDASFLPQCEWLKKRIRSNVYDLLPESLQTAWDRASGWPPLFIPTKSELERLLRNNGFHEISIVSHPSHLPGVPSGRKFEATATKPIP
jgi:SAM-dependent methyltransferase